MLNDNQRQDIARQIFGCFTENRQIPLLTASHPDIGMEDAYRIQELVIDRFRAAGSRIKGYKIGLTSKAMQEMAGTNEPDFSAVPDHLFLPDGGRLSSLELSDPLVEIEIAFVMKERLQGPGIEAADVIRATDYVLPSIELVDFRVARAPGMTVRDTIADLAAVGRVVLGNQAKRLEDIDIREIGGDLLINGELKESGKSAAVLGDPINAIVWLANKLGEFGVTFEPGDVVLSGSFIRAIPVRAGDQVTARFGNGFGNVTLYID